MNFIIFCSDLEFSRVIEEMCRKSTLQFAKMVMFVFV